MKFKFRTFLALGLGLGVLGGSLLSINNKMNKKAIEAEAATNFGADINYFPVDDAHFYKEENSFGVGGTGVGGITSERRDTFHDGKRSFNALDNFINTITKVGEGHKGWIRSNEWVNTGGYVSFLLGGRNNGANGSSCFVNIWMEPEVDKPGEDVYAGIKSDFYASRDSYDSDYINGNASDFELTANVALKYFDLTAERFIGRRFIVYIMDDIGTDQGSYGGIVFGDLRVNQTIEDVARTFSTHKRQIELDAQLSNQNNYSATYMLNTYYADTTKYGALIDKEAQLKNANEDFERYGLTNWAYDGSFATANINFASAISNATHKVDSFFDVGMPFNKTDSYFFNADSTGIGEGEKYRLVSNTFTLGTDVISAKLGGGTAVLELYDEDKDTTYSTAIAEATGTNILRPGFVGGSQEDSRNLADSGARLSTMSRVFLDVSGAKGHKVHIRLADGRTGGEWGLAYFDEVITNYDETPAFQVGVGQQAAHYVIIPDEYSGPANTDFGKAHAFWRNYLDVVRGGKYGNNYCSSRVSDEIKALLGNDGYNGLTATAKQIVCASVDYERVGSAENYYDKEPVIYEATDTYNIARSIQYLAEENGVSVTVYNPSASRTVFGIADNSVGTMILVIGLSIVCIIACALVLKSNKRRKIEK